MNNRKIQNNVQNKKLRFNRPRLAKKNSKETKSIEIIKQKMNASQKKQNLIKKQTQSFRQSLQKNYNSPRISIGFKNILSFQRKIAKLNTTCSENNFKIKNRYSQMLTKTTRMSIIKSREMKNYNLVPAQKMMLDFQRQLRKIRQTSKLKYNADSIIQKIERFQAFYATMTGMQTIQNKDCIKVKDGICILCDGHGSNGKQISQFICSGIFEKCLKKKKQNQLNVKILQQIFQRVTLELQVSGIDLLYSGSTCILVVCLQCGILVANLGDSRAILIKNNHLFSLSKKHIIDIQNERRRIQKEGGIIRQIQMTKHKMSKALRIWNPSENIRGPNLTVTRQFGNKIARKNGLISEPQIMAYQQQYNEELLIIASNSLFQVIKCEEITEIVRDTEVCDADSRQKLCQLILQQAIRRAGRQLDDISLILIYI